MFILLCAMAAVACLIKFWPESAARQPAAGVSPPPVAPGQTRYKTSSPRLMSSVEVIRGKDKEFEVPWKAGLRLIHVVAKTGGLTSFESQKAIIVRDDKTLGKYDLSRSPLGDQNNPLLLPGDLIIFEDD